MAEFDAQERFTGLWNGEQVSPKRVFRGHRFTDEEVDALLAGETIQIRGLKAKTGNEYGVYGKLDHCSFTNSDGEEVNYIGFNQEGFLGNDTIPETFCQHTFTDAERTKLEAGEEIFCEGLIGKSGKMFNAYCTWDTTDPNNKRINLRFENQE